MRKVGRDSGRPWAGRYPPLLVVVIVLALAIFALPSALNLPQANPGQTTEYAPVPGNQGGAPPGGNLAALGLGAGNNGAGGALQPPPPGLANTGLPASGKQCVGSPPRQTEDLLSPPCVAFFNGDNGGATYQGVTRDEVRILVYEMGGGNVAPTDSGTEQLPEATMFDLWQPPSRSEPTTVRVLRDWQRYFTDRYQTYGRRAHVFVYYGSCSATTAGNGCINSSDTAKADAAATYAQVHPFAILDYGDYGDAFLNVMAGHGVMSFGGLDMQTSAFYHRYPQLLWGYQPSAEIQASMFATYLCNQIAPYRVTFSGNGDIGAPRKYGLIYANDPSKPNLTYFSTLVRQQVSRCGIDFPDSGSFSLSGYEGPNPVGDNTYAATNMARFKQDNVTTVIWAGGFETQQSAAAASIHYYPEWVTWGGDHRMDQQTNTAYQDQNVWSHAWDVTPDLVTVKDMGEPQCDQEFRTVDPGASTFTMLYACSPYYTSYDDLRQLFTGIQVSGPSLQPANIERGFRAIPPRPSTTPNVPACFYDADDYTCVKDAMIEYWDPFGAAGGTLDTHGCWRVAAGAQRYLRGGWPRVEATTEQRPGSDPCNTL